MKEEKQKLVIFEEDEILISVWRDYFSENYNLSFLDFNSNVRDINKYINKKTIFICNKAVNKNVIDKVKENKILYIIDADQNATMCTRIDGNLTPIISTHCTTPWKMKMEVPRYSNKLTNCS